LGVAGGNGLVSLEEHAKQISKLFSIGIDIYGFDSGEGLPEPKDYRDLPYHWKGGFYKMDVPKLQARLQNAKLVLGDIKDTGKEFFTKYNPAPIGGIMFDLDFYSSTVEAFRMLDAEEKYFLPRVFCYFDDVLGGERELYNDYTGERLAITEFNQAHQSTKLAVGYHLLSRPIAEPWYSMIWVCHFFKHSRYNDYVGFNEEDVNLNLSS
jgi:hypothetical protein